VLVVDEKDLLQWGFRTLLGAEPWVARCIAARSPDEAIDLVRETAPEIALVDALVGGTPGLALCRKLRDTLPDIAVVLMSAAGRVSPACAKEAGASGFVSKCWSGKDIVGVLRVIALGATVFAPDTDDLGGTLSTRELQVLRLIAAGATNREIAARLYLSPHTIKEYATALYRKIEARNRAEAVLQAQRLGLLM